MNDSFEREDVDEDVPTPFSDQLEELEEKYGLTESQHAKELAKAVAHLQD